MIQQLETLDCSSTAVADDGYGDGCYYGDDGNGSNLAVNTFYC